MDNSIKKYLENLAKSNAKGISVALPEKNIDSKKTTVFIGAGTCGLGAGAAKTKAAVEEYFKTNKIDGEIIEVGCIGFCAVEPIMDVKLPGMNRVSFSKVTADKVSTILDNAFAGKIDKDSSLGQFKTEGLKSWDSVKINEHPFFVKQKRLVLKNSESLTLPAWKNISRMADMQAL